MKYRITVCATFIIFAFLTSVQAADLKEGFMGYRWGENISNYHELNELHSKGDVTYYSNPGESFTIDDIIIDDVVYGFYKRKLFAVYVGIDSLDTFDAIKRYLHSKYGLPGTKVSTTEYLTIHKWKHDSVTIKLKTDDIGGKMKLGLYYRPLSHELYGEQMELFDEKPYRFFPIDKNKTPRLVPFLEF